MMGMLTTMTRISVTDILMYPPWKDYCVCWCMMLVFIIWNTCLKDQDGSWIMTVRREEQEEFLRKTGGFFLVSRINRTQIFLDSYSGRYFSWKYRCCSLQSCFWKKQLLYGCQRRISGYWLPEELSGCRTAGIICE